MRLRILGNAGGSCRGFYSMSALVNDQILLDAGTGVQRLGIGQVKKVEHVLLTHSHLDHTAMLFFLMDCQIGAHPGLRVHALQETATALRKGFLNDKIWPDFENIKINGNAVMSFRYLKPYQTVELCGCKITPLPVRHAVPTLGFCLHGEREDFVFVSDIIDADAAFWRYLKSLKRLRRMTMEVSFPDSMAAVAKESCHLTPKSFAGLLKKIPAGVEVFYCHTKPQAAARVGEEMRRHFGSSVKPLKRDDVFDL